MATPRRPLGPISGNSTVRKELSPYQRGLIVGQAQKGAKPLEISRDLNIPRTTIISTLELDLLRNEGKSIPRPGRPLCYTPRNERVLLRFIRNNPKCSYNDIRQACGVIISNSTLKTILDKHGISNWRAKKRPYLSEEVAQKRLL